MLILTYYHPFNKENILIVFSMDPVLKTKNSILDFNTEFQIQIAYNSRCFQYLLHRHKISSMLPPVGLSMIVKATITTDVL